jgi:hypothetical protein
MGSVRSFTLARPRIPVTSQVQRKISGRTKRVLLSRGKLVTALDYQLSVHSRIHIATTNYTANKTIPK